MHYCPATKVDKEIASRNNMETPDEVPDWVVTLEEKEDMT